MKFILPLSLSFLGISLSVAHRSMESHVEIRTTTHLKQSSIISTLSLLPKIQNIALLVTLPALGIYTTTLIGIGIMSSNVQAIPFGSSGGLDSSPDWAPSSSEPGRKRRGHLRDVSVVATGIEHKNSYHVAVVLIKKSGDLIRRINGQHADFESPKHLPKFTALDSDNADKGESTNIDPLESCTDSSEQHHDIKSDLKIQRNGNTLRSRGLWESFLTL
ncbi:hypothetical protein BofuT4_P093980.1 [Botrytis cinerea T4]|uniref:Uncharacterized protein n=1 Tax=Botryotinia fuckeliana (strain T4) TaxID=999810 RepID=G2YD42_BOTF4|nr:hypothetical protein BofuT4_P093980.1 [Botrytis cinerea T4]